MNLLSQTSSIYRYENLQNDWIIHQGYLEYLHGETVFKYPSFRRYFVVLMCIPNEIRGNLVVLSLYTEKSKNFYKYILVETGDQLNDRCRKLIEGKTGLFFMELVIKQNGRGEIFGAQSVPERKVWIEKFDETMLKLQLKPISRSVSDTHGSRPNIHSEQRSNPINYAPFKDEETTDYLAPIQSLPNDISIHQSCIEQLVIRGVNPIDSYEEEKTVQSEIVDEQTSFSWEKIFYLNRKDDFATILNDIGQTGAFLVRPQLTRTSSSDHDYTLCVYDDGHIYKYGIYQSSQHQYLLKYRDHEPHFHDVCELCQYYTSHPLRATLKEGFNKNIYLTVPYTHKNMYY